MIGILSLIPGSRTVQGLVVAAVVASVVGAVTYGVHSYNEGLRDEGRKEVRAEWDAAEALRASQLATIKQKAVDDTQALQNKADAQRKASNDQIAALNGNLRRALDGLRDRPERPNSAGSGGVPAPAPAGASCTGASLYRPDSEFLTRLAGDADKLRIALETCQTQYNAARDALK